MKIAKNSLALCAVLSLALMGTALADNLVQNSDFETGDLTGWLVFGQTPLSDVTVVSGDNGPSAPGTNNAFMDNQAEALGLTLKYSTEAGSGIEGTVNYSYDLLLDQADAGGVLFVEIFAEQEGGGVIGSSGLQGPLWAWEWTSYSGSFMAPAGTDFLTIQIMANTGAAVGSNCLAHVDNVVLDQGTVAAEATTWSQVKALYR